MKGTIACCLRDMVVEKFGAESWNNVIEKSGMNKHDMILVMDDLPDAKVMEVIGNTCKELKITLEQAADAFGEYWAVTYAPRIYKSFYMGAKNSKDFLKRLDSIHDITTKTMSNAAPPRFFYEDKEGGSLVMTYQSKRNLMPIFQGLIKGVGKYFNEDLKINLVAPDKVEIIFPK